jgi:hypothetical protein
MKHQTCKLVPNTLAKHFMVLEGCYMMLSEIYYSSQVVVEKKCYSRKIQPQKSTSDSLKR